MYKEHYCQINCAALHGDVIKFATCCALSCLWFIIY